MTQTNLANLMEEAGLAAIKYQMEPTKHNLAEKYVASMVYYGALNAYWAACDRSPGRRLD